MSRHTPGPWEAERDDASPSHLIRMASALEDRAVHLPHHLVIYDHDIGEDAPEFAEVEANARLIAAAPDLLAACEMVERHLAELVAAWGDEGVTRRLRQRLHAAIAKATELAG